MSAAEGLVWVLRAFGALYVVGAIFLFRMLRMDSFLDKALRQIEDASDAPRGVRIPEDRSRNVWLAAGGALTLAAGAAMLFAHRFAVPLLALLVVQQLLYFLRQRRRELRAATPEEAEDARPTAQTRSGFYYSLVLAVLAAWLGWQGALT